MSELDELVKQAQLLDMGYELTDEELYDLECQEADLQNDIKWFEEHE